MTNAYWSIGLRFAFALTVAVTLLATGGRSASVDAAGRVFVHPTDPTCAGMGTAGADCFTTIQEAIENAGPAPAEVLVFPGSYAESVDLSGMGSAVSSSPGTVSIIAVNEAGASTPGVAMVNPLEGPAIFNSEEPFAGTIEIDGLSVTSPDEDGIDFEVDGDVVIAHVAANGADLDGVDVDASGNVTIRDSIANGNGGDGFSATGVDVAITNSTANDNTGEGFDWGDVEGAVIANRLTAVGNGATGVGIDSQDGGDVDSITFRNSWIQGNDQGFDLADLAPAGTFSLNGNIICGHALEGMLLASNVTLDAEANWWGDASGPAPIGIGDLVVDGSNGGSGIVDSTPWIDTVTSSADPATVGGSSPVTFQFSGGPGFLGQGPGDPNGPPPFVLTTNNGTLTTPAESGVTVPMSLNAPNGTVEVTLTPQAEGPATVTLTGPCGLDSSIVLDVGPMLPAPVAGDVNGDGAATIADALLMAQCVAGLTGPCAAEGDVNGDGAATIADALIIAQFVAGLVRSL